jgi:hypothetical protein
MPSHASIVWREPWQPVVDARETILEAELRREVAPPHPLHEQPASAIGRRADADDVLFLVEARFAVVHLTWTAAAPDRPPWPMTRFFADVDELSRDCLVPDADLY